MREDFVGRQRLISPDGERNRVFDVKSPQWRSERRRQSTTQPRVMCTLAAQSTHLPGAHLGRKQGNQPLGNNQVGITPPSDRQWTSRPTPSVASSVWTNPRLATDEARLTCTNPSERRLALRRNWTIRKPHSGRWKRNGNG
jgi:hypothetical protein